MTEEERVELADKYLSAALENGKGLRIAGPLWPSMVPLTGAEDVHRPFGVSTPQYLEYDEKWVFFYCPEIVVECSTLFTDEEYREWVQCLCAHVRLHTKADQPFDVEQQVEERLAEVLPCCRGLSGRVMEGMFI